MMDYYERQRHQQIPSGLTRFRSAPSSYFATILSTAASGGDGGGVGGRFGSDDFGKLFNPRDSSPRTQGIFARFMNTTTDSIQEKQNSSPLNPHPPSLSPRQKFPAGKPPRRRRPREQQSTDYSSLAMYQTLSSALESSYNKSPQSASAGGGLVRHNSSPAGLFDSIEMETSVGQVRKDRGNDSIPDFPMSPWDDTTILSDDFIKGLTDDDTKTSFDTSDNQKDEVGNRPPIPLSHHLSLPKSAFHKLLQDSVPCKLRAKRGYATHPRSIAERVRRNKISERTRKLQELVPNMEKQMNTADMLDLAVDYIKDLQRQVKILYDNRANCTCSAKRTL